jgi:predicted kinase
VLTVGLPASGKSRFCRALAAATGALVLESDALRTALFAPATHDTDESRRLFDAVYGAARRLLAQRANVIVDATNLRERDREQAYAAAEAAGADVLVLHFRAPQRVIAARLAARGRGEDPDDCSTAGMAVYDKLAETEEPIRRQHRRIDTSYAAATRAALNELTEILAARRLTAVRPDTGGSTL